MCKELQIQIKVLWSMAENLICNLCAFNKKSLFLYWYYSEEEDDESLHSKDKETKDEQEKETIGLGKHEDGEFLIIRRY